MAAPSQMNATDPTETYELTLRITFPAGEVDVEALLEVLEQRVQQFDERIVVNTTDSEQQ